MTGLSINECLIGWKAWFYKISTQIYTKYLTLSKWRKALERISTRSANSLSRIQTGTMVGRIERNGKRLPIPWYYPIVGATGKSGTSPQVRALQQCHAGPVLCQRGLTDPAVRSESTIMMLLKSYWAVNCDRNRIRHTLFLQAIIPSKIWQRCWWYNFC